MDTLIKQTRSRFGDSRQEESNSTIRDKKLPLQKTQSFRGEKRRNQLSWIRRQFSSRQMSLDDFDTDYPAAVAAAAYAVQSLEQSNQKQNLINKTAKMTKADQETRNPPQRLKSALKSSDENSRKSLKGTPDQKTEENSRKSPKKRLSFAGNDEIINGTTLADTQLRSPSSMKMPSADKDLKIMTVAKNPELTTPVDEKRAQTARKNINGPGDSSKADAWEKQEMAKINERYDKHRAKIEDWETKKRRNAKRKIERIEAELDKRRVKASQSYRTDMMRIEGIAGGAKAQAEQNRRKEESKVKEKANKIRLTGKLPAMCFCF